MRHRSTKAGTRIPATPTAACRLPAPAVPLNEGRDQNPGDTAAADLDPAGAGVRSTKAGTRIPATRHRPSGHRAGQGRSTKAGTRIPATPGAHRHLRAGHEQRSTKAGTRIPATLGETGACAPGGWRSTKAGTRIPATLEPDTGHHAAPSRSTKAGTRIPATLEVSGKLDPLGQGRSTKAGTRIPATQQALRRIPVAESALNEGRDQNPGDTRARRVPRLRCIPLNEGRDQNPGDTFDTGGEGDGGTCAQRRPGPESRRHVAPGDASADFQGRSNEGRDQNPGDTSSRARS